MGYVPFSRERASIGEKQRIARKLEALGITSAAGQIAFLETLLNKHLDASNISKQDIYDAGYKLNNLKAAKEKK